MVFLLNLPCSAKQELKKSLEIPLTEVVKKNTQLGVCTLIHHLKAIDTHKDNSPTLTFSSVDFLKNIPVGLLQLNIQELISQTKWKSSKVPLFILQERYRI